METDIYIPINCNLYDQLEAFATLKTKVTISFRAEDEVKLIEEVLIVDFKTKTTGEFGYFFRNENRFSIRLDKLISINGSNVRDEFGHSCTISNKK